MTQQEKTQQGGFKKGKISLTNMFIDVAFWTHAQYTIP